VKTEPARLADNHVVLRLKALSKEAAQLASTLARPVPEAGLGDEGGAGREQRHLPSHQEVLRMLVEAQRARVRHFPPGVFSDPAWDMLLDLMGAKLAGRTMTVSSLCLAADVPATTALRWLNALAEPGLIRRLPDPADRRRVLVELTEEGLARMEAYLRTIQSL
jgi:DNA-binding MarR family transcriptional regulator